MSIKQRLAAAGKSFFNPQTSRDEDGERNILTVLDSIGFGKTTLKKVLNEGYATNTHVYSIINRIAESAADIPVLIQSIDSRGDIEIVTEGDFFEFVHRPNTERNYKQFTYEAIVYQLATGNEFQYGVRSIGSQAFMERWNLAPQYMEIKSQNLATGPIATGYKYNYAGKDYKYEVEEMLHIAKFNPDPGSPNPVMGLSPLQAAYRTLVASNETITADASLIKNRGAFGFISSRGTGRPTTPEEGKGLDKSLRSKTGGATKFGSYPITSGQFDFVQLAMSPTDLKILENATMKLRDLCSVYGISSRMFNDPNGTTFNNSKEDGKKFYTQGVLPPLENEIDQFNRFYVPGWNERDGKNYKLVLDISSIEALQEDQAKEMVKARTRSGIIQTVLKGIGVDWDEASANLQLQDALGMTEAEATAIIGSKPEPPTPSNELTPTV